MTAKEPPRGTPRDQIYQDEGQDLVDFVFDERVASVFPDMIRRSVPGYELVTTMVGVAAARHLQPDSRCYDLGCAEGATARAIQHAVRQLQGDISFQLIGVDNSQAMLDQAQQIDQRRDAAGRAIQYICSDCEEIVIDNASVVAMTYTLQFIAPELRLDVLRRIRGGMRPGGVLLLAEKLAGSDEFVGWHEDFKRANGYSELEVAQKRAALEVVMIPESADVHQDRLRDAGFTTVTQWFQCLNWGGFVATV